LIDTDIFIYGNNITNASNLELFIDDIKYTDFDINTVKNYIKYKLSDELGIHKVVVKNN